MTGLVPVIHVFAAVRKKLVDRRDKPGDDDLKPRIAVSSDESLA
jgi:hypothetical protein